MNRDRIVFAVGLLIMIVCASAQSLFVALWTSVAANFVSWGAGLLSGGPLRVFLRRRHWGRWLLRLLGSEIPRDDWQAYSPREDAFGPLGRDPSPYTVVPTEPPTRHEQPTPFLAELNQFVKESAGSLVTRIDDSLRLGEARKIILVAPPGSGQRDILRQIHRNLLTRPGAPIPARGVHFFDCSSVPDFYLHEYFLGFLASSFHAVDKSEVVCEPAEGPAEQARPQEHAPRLSLDLLKEQIGHQKNRSVLLLADVHRLKDPVDGDCAYSASYGMFADEARRVLKYLAKRQKHVSVVLSVAGEPDRSWAKWFASFEREDVTKQKRWHQTRERVVAHLLGADGAGLICPELSFDEISLLARTVSRMPPAERMRALSVLFKQVTDPGERAKLVVEWSMDAAARDLASGLSVDRAGAAGACRALVDRALAALSHFEWALSDRNLREIWQPLFDDAARAVGYESPRGLAVGLKAAFLNVGLCQDLRTEAAKFLPFHFPSPTAWRHAKDHLVESQRDLPDTAGGKGFKAFYRNKKFQIAKDYSPCGPTAVSRYLSGGTFHRVGDLSGVIRERNGNEQCVVLLSREVEAVLSPLQGEDGSTQVRMLPYDWATLSGGHHEDLALLLSAAPTPWQSYWRVRVHVTSREGTGSVVLRAIEEVADVVHVVGDAYRCGPGGVVEALVRQRRDNGGRTPADAQRQLEYRLATSTNAKASVEVVPCLPEDVHAEAAPKLEKIQGVFRILTDAADLGIGASGVSALVMEGPALRHLKRHLGATRRPTESPRTVDLKCYVGPSVGQAVLVVGQRSQDEQLCLYLSPEPIGGLRGSDIARQFMNAAAENGLNLLSLQPVGQFGCRADLQVAQDDGGAVLESLRKQLGPKVKLTMLRTSDASDESVPAFGEDAWAKLDPAVYHREMRRHLFIPDADAAIVALVCSEIGESKMSRGEYKALEIGSGSGALTQKLMSAGILNIDTAEPAEALRNYWTHVVLKDWSGRRSGDDFACRVQDLAVPGPEHLYDILVSQGVHHHWVPEPDVLGERRLEAIERHRRDLLWHCANLLKPGGAYVVCDEFVSEYGDDEATRKKNLDIWYECVIARALSDGLSALAQMEYSFWSSDRDAKGEYKESTSRFERRIRSLDGQPFIIESRVVFGLTDACPGGFAAYVLRRSQQNPGKTRPSSGDLGAPDEPSGEGDGRLATPRG